MESEGTVSRDSTSLDKDLTRLRKGLEDDSAADLHGEEELELAGEGLTGSRSDGQEELAGGLEERVDVGLIVKAGECVCGSGSEGCTDKVVDKTGRTAGPEGVSAPADSNSSSSFASKPVATHWSSAAEAGP